MDQKSTKQRTVCFPVAVTIALGGLQEPLDLGLGEVLAGAQGGVGWTLGRDRSIYDGWRDQLEM